MIVLIGLVGAFARFGLVPKPSEPRRSAFAVPAKGPTPARTQDVVAPVYPKPIELAPQPRPAVPQAKLARQEAPPKINTINVKGQLRTIFSAIDPQILREIDAGNLSLDVRVDEASFGAISDLSRTPEGKGLLDITAATLTHGNLIMNGSLGTSRAGPQYVTHINFSEGMRE